MLISNDIMMEISGLSLRAMPVVLKGYTKYSLNCDYFPVIIPDKDS